MTKEKAITRFFPAFILLIALALIPPALGEKTGEIYYLSYSPAEPVVFEDVKTSVSVQNPSDKAQNYLMQVQVVKDGRLLSEQEFTFSLEKGKGVAFSPTYTPNDIGEHDLIIKLYDKLMLNLFDTKIITFNVVSQLGPFDIIIEPMAKAIKPGLYLPAKILLENMGIKGTDVEVRISVNCDNPMTQSLTTFVPARSRTERLASIAVCNREGLYELTASIMLFNKTWISSTNQFFVNSSIVQLTFDAPDNITLQAGQSLVFPVNIKNTGNEIINDIQFVVERIPLAWQKTSPSSIQGVHPNETAIFIVNITIPSDAEPDSFEIRMTAAVDETVEKKFSYLTVTSAGASQSASQPSGTPLLDYAPLLLVVPVLAVAILILKRLKRGRAERPSYHFDELKKGIYHYNPKKDRSSGRR